MGLGWHLQGATNLDFNGEPIWAHRPVFEGYGRCSGHSAAIAEVLAFQCLCHSIDQFLHFGDCSAATPPPPWAPEAIVFDEKPQPSLQWIDVKHEWRETDFALESMERVDVPSSTDDDSDTSSSETPMQTADFDDQAVIGAVGSSQCSPSLMKQVLAPFPSLEELASERRTELVSQTLEPWRPTN